MLVLKAYLAGPLKSKLRKQKESFKAKSSPQKIQLPKGPSRTKNTTESEFRYGE